MAATLGVSVPQAMMSTLGLDVALSGPNRAQAVLRPIESGELAGVFDARAKCGRAGQEDLRRADRVHVSFGRGVSRSRDVAQGEMPLELSQPTVGDDFGRVAPRLMLLHLVAELRPLAQHR